jgi:single-strand DNA-binding protein
MEERMTLGYKTPEKNSVCVVGRVSKAPELRRTSTGKAVCSFDIAISRKIKDAATGQWKSSEPTFVPIVVWNEQGERCKEKLQKGYSVHIEGKLQGNNWTAQDGTNRSRLVIVASRVQSLSIVKEDHSASIGASIGEVAKAMNKAEEKTETGSIEDSAFMPF